MFADINAAPADPIFSINQAFNEDQSPQKVNLSVGAYRNDSGEPVIFEAVQRAGEEIYANSMTKYNKEYLPMGGNKRFCDLSQSLVFGENDKTVASVQALSGTGSLCVVGEFLSRFYNKKAPVYVSDPTWPNHNAIYGELLGFEVRIYPYWDASNRSCNIPAMLKCLNEAPSGSIIILHVCAHNPTGQDPNHEEWKEILEVVKARKHFAILDCAYQGFASSDFEEDAYSIRLFHKAGIQFAVCQSYAKNMGLYGERCGCLHVKCCTEAEAVKVRGRLARICRMLWSNPPKHGAELATIVLEDPELAAIWKNELKTVAGRIKEMRQLLRAGLEARKTPGQWDHITKQIGMFSYTGLTPDQVTFVTEKYHIYLLKSGRISMAGVNTGNVNYLCDAIDDAIRSSPAA